MLGGGRKEFWAGVIVPLMKRYPFGEPEWSKFLFTGIHVEEVPQGIYLDQHHYIKNMKEVPVEASRDAAGRLPHWFAPGSGGDPAAPVRDRCAKTGRRAPCTPRSLGSGVLDGQAPVHRDRDAGDVARRRQDQAQRDMGHLLGMPVAAQRRAALGEDRLVLL